MALPGIGFDLPTRGDCLAALPPYSHISRVGDVPSARSGVTRHSTRMFFYRHEAFRLMLPGREARERIDHEEDVRRGRALGASSDWARVTGPSNWGPSNWAE